MTACVQVRRFRAPGKIVLLGEYAVVDGAPAIVAAIDHGVECVAMPSFTSERTIESPGDGRFARAALDAAEAPGGYYRFVDWNPVDVGGGKPGFGGSAAATVVAVLAGLLLRGKLASPNGVCERAAVVHKAVQGSGSGVDVAASAHGGVLRFTRGNVRRLQAVRPVVVWSGKSAETGPRVERYLAWSGRDAFVRASTEVVDRFEEEPVAAMRENRRLLASMAASAGVDWASPALDLVARLAEERGGAAKPSGAGGGDCAVALFDDPEAEAAFVLACDRHGLRVVPAAVADAAGEVPDSASCA